MFSEKLDELLKQEILKMSSYGLAIKDHHVEFACVRKLEYWARKLQRRYWGRI